MLLWTVFAALTALAALMIVRPYWRQGVGEAAQGQDVAVYTQQLAEIEDETSRGLLGEAEAHAARIEISRRILAAAEKIQAGGGAPKSSLLAPYIIIGLLAVVSMGAYLSVGSPNLPDQPLSARLAPDLEPEVDGMIARVEERLRSNPEDGAGWSVIAPVYYRMGRYADAAKAYRKAMQLLGETTELRGDLAESLSLANGGVVPDEAATAFLKVLAADAENERAQFWLGMSDEQGGRLAEAAGRYRKLLAQPLPDNIQALVKQRLGGVESQLAGAPSASAEQTAMINGMVMRLAERLNTDGSDLDGWLKLMRAYTVLGRRDDALTALKRAQGHFSGNQEALGQIDRMAKSLGLIS